jgi:hypothetical protein
LAKRPRLLLLDTNAVFVAFRYGAWEGLCAAYEVVLPTTVIHESIFYLSRETGRRVELDLMAEVQAGRVTEITASAGEIAQLLVRFDLSFRKQIEAGEAEALAYLVTREDEEMRFVSADGAALEAVGMLGIAERAMCLAEALHLCGLGRPLPRQHERTFFRAHVALGQRRFVTGEGLVR